MVVMDPKPIIVTSESVETYSGPDPQPFVAVGGISGTLIEDPLDPGTYIIVGA